MPDCNKEIKIFNSKSDAERTAQTIGGTVKSWKQQKERNNMLKIVIGTNEGKVLCISNNEDEIKASMVNYLIDTDQEPTEDFFESRNWGEYDIEVYEYHQPH